MDKYTIVIPTLWKSNRTQKLLSDLEACEWVDEIILIDNTLSYASDNTKGKIRTISYGENIYVNPAWNVGVELAKNECIALCNDDINFDANIFGAITQNVLGSWGIVGMGEGNYKSLNIEGEPRLTEWMPGINDWGWGCLILLLKKHWKPIPNGINVWYGDNFIKDCNSIPKACLRNFRIDTEMSTTSDEKEWDEVKRNDLQNWIKYLHNGK